MPLIYVHRGSPAYQTFSVGTQYIEGTLSFPGETVVELDPALFTQAGIYVLFDYSNGSFPSPGQLANVTVDDSDLVGLNAGSLVNDPTNSRITVTLS